MKNILGIALTVFVIAGCILFIAGMIIGDSFPKPLMIVAVCSCLVSAAMNISNFLKHRKH